MGGQHGSRGYMYQAVVAVLEALQNDNWDEIFVEYKTEEEKVDIALKRDNKLIMSYQVKSSVNLFTAENIKAWICELVNDETAEEYCIYLIGNYEKDANEFVKSIKKFYDNLMDGIAEKSLNGFIDILEKHRVVVKIAINDTDFLLGIVRDTINRYCSSRGHTIPFAILEQLALSLITLVYLLGTDGKYISRSKYDNKIVNWLDASSNGKMKAPKSLSDITVKFFNPVNNATQDEVCFVNIIDMPGYKSIVESYAERAKRLIELISKMELNPCSRLPFNNNDIYAENFVFPNTVYAELNNNEKIEFIARIKKHLDIEVGVSFFNNGELTKNNLFTVSPFGGGPSLSGTGEEKEKYEHIEELRGVLLNIESLAYFIGCYKDAKLLLLCLKNESSYPDKSITLTLVPNRKDLLFDLTSCTTEEEREILDVLAGVLVEDDILAKIFIIETPEASIEEEVTLPTIYTPPMSTMLFGRSRHTYESLEFELEDYCARIEPNGTISYSFKELRAKESKWVLPHIVLNKDSGGSAITYSVLSHNTDGTCTGSIILPSEMD